MQPDQKQIVIIAYMTKTSFIGVDLVSSYGTWTCQNQYWKWNVKRVVQRMFNDGGKIGFDTYGGKLAVNSVDFPVEATAIIRSAMNEEMRLNHLSTVEDYKKTQTDSVRLPAPHVIHIVDFCQKKHKVTSQYTSDGEVARIQLGQQSVMYREESLYTSWSTSNMR